MNFPVGSLGGRGRCARGGRIGTVKGRRGVRRGRPFVRIGRAAPSTPIVIVLKVAGGGMLGARRGRRVVLVGKAKGWMSSLPL